MNLQLRRARLEFYQYQVKLKKIIKNQILVLGAFLSLSEKNQIETFRTNQSNFPTT